VSSDRPTPPKPGAASRVPRQMRRRSLLTLVATAGFVARAHGVRAAEPKRVVVQPLGAGGASAEVIRRALVPFYEVDVVVAESSPLPKAAYYRPRNRYRAEKLLEHLATLHGDVFRVLGVTEVDISTTKGNTFDWGILGLASIDGQTCVLSAFRCRRSARDRAHAEERLGKTAVHELGHTFGLEHCPASGCLMRDGGGTVLTTDGERDLCAGCRTKLRERGLLRADARSPWA
jgi:archaemetzincin